MNLAWRGVPSVSSTYDRFDVHIYNLVDGIISTCWRSTIEDNPWIIVDILDEFQMTDIILQGTYTGIGECCALSSLNL